MRTKAREKHLWFAWHPVRVWSHSMGAWLDVWLETIYRQESGPVHDPHWCYGLIEEFHEEDGVTKLIDQPKDDVKYVKAVIEDGYVKTGKGWFRLEDKDDA